MKNRCSTISATTNLHMPSLQDTYDLAFISKFIPSPCLVVFYVCAYIYIYICTIYTYVLFFLSSSSVIEIDRYKRATWIMIHAGMVQVVDGNMKDLDCVSSGAIS